MIRNKKLRLLKILDNLIEITHSYLVSQTFPGGKKFIELIEF